MRVTETQKQKSISKYFRNSFVWKVMWWKKSQKVCYTKKLTLVKICRLKFRIYTLKMR